MSASKKIFVEFKCQVCGKQVRRPRRLDLKNHSCGNKCSLKLAVEASRSVDKSGENNPFWHGGKRHALGYVYLLAHGHPKANDKGYVQEHRLIMEVKIGRYLNDKERVHHINGIKDDNRIENLRLYGSQGEHTKEHIKNGDINLYYWKGKKRSIQTKLKMSVAHKKLWKIRKSA